MRIAELQQKIEGDLKWHSVEDIPDFPFANLHELKEKVKINKYTMGINFTISNNLAQWLYGQWYGYFFLLVASTPFIVPVLSIGLAIYFKNFWLLFGVILPIISWFMANPYNPSKGFFDLVVNMLFIGMIGALFTGYETIAWIIAFFVVPFKINRFIYYRNQDKLKEVALNHEKILIYLYQTGSLGFRDNSTNESYWHFQK